MLTRMYLTNFLSFKDRTEFDFTYTSNSILAETNVYKDKVLKGGLFIGPNASGKSNALKGISLIIKMIKGEGASLNHYRCMFSNSPVTKVEYEFLFDTKRIEYAVSYNYITNILAEELKIDDSIVIKREGNKGELFIGQDVKVDEKVDEDTLFLRTASFNTGRFPQEPTLRALMDYLQNSFIANEYNAKVKFGDSITRYAEKFGVEKLNNYLKLFNYNFTIEYGIKAQGEGIQIGTGTGEKTVFFKRNSFPIPFFAQEESQGNQVFADLLTYLTMIIETPGMLIIDEFGNSLHNKLSEKIISFFMSSANNSQVFLTSHHTNLVSNSVFRPDQIYLFSFYDKDGSKMKRLSQFNPREAQNLEKMYLGGMFEGLPVYEEIQN